MRAFRTLLAVLIPAALLAGCDTIEGFGRSADLDTLPDAACVTNAVRSTPGIVEVRLDLGEHPERGYVVMFQGTPQSHIYGILQIQNSDRGTFTYGNGIQTLNIPPPQEDVDATRPVLLVMERKLAGDCGLAVLPAKIKETCIDVVCKPLETP